MNKDKIKAASIKKAAYICTECWTQSNSLRKCPQCGSKKLIEQDKVIKFSEGERVLRERGRQIIIGMLRMRGVQKAPDGRPIEAMTYKELWDVLYWLENRKIYCEICGVPLHPDDPISTEHILCKECRRGSY